jgi:pyridoxal phosphate enzyme (YggS family)
MNSIINNFEKIKALINNSKVNIIAVSKSFQYDHIRPLLDHGHKHFGENKVQEALIKWAKVKDQIPDMNLHMIGRLQSNKSKDAVKLFDYIHSLDSFKLADLLAKFEKSLNLKRKYFIQINIGNEKQKSGIKIEELDEFYVYCTKTLQLNVVGLMAIPPVNENAVKCFKLLMELNQSLGLTELSMGMSDDFKEALKYKTTYVRIGSAIFGKRS